MASLKEAWNAGYDRLKERLGDLREQLREMPERFRRREAADTRLPPPVTARPRRPAFFRRKTYVHVDH